MGRKDGKRYRTREARENCTSMCMAVVNIGNGKPSLSGENIHLLYYKIGQYLMAEIGQGFFGGDDLQVISTGKKSTITQ